MPTVGQQEHAGTARRSGAAVACLAAALLGGGCASSPSVGSPGEDFERTEAFAPIESADLLIRESFPPQYAVRVVSGVPSGCAEFARVDVERSGNALSMTVWNTVPADDDVACTMIYGTTENTVELGTDFVSGESYTVRINGDTELDFTAQ